MSQTSRQRILDALEHRSTDRVPIDFGSTNSTGITAPAYYRLLSHLGLDVEASVFDRAQQLVYINEEVLERFSVDTRGLIIKGPDRLDEELPNDSFRDEWGIIRRRPSGGLYYDLVFSPLGEHISSSILEHYPWPDPKDPGRFRGLRQEAEYWRSQGDHALVLQIRGGFITQAELLRGFGNFWMDLLLQPELAGELLDYTLAFSMGVAKAALDNLGVDNVDILGYGDDIAMQTGCLVSPELYRQILKPRQARFIHYLKDISGGKKILYHSCGAVAPLIEDLIEIGVDALNPVQTSASGMDLRLLKERFGDRIAFWGGIDTQHLLNRAATEEVAAETKKIIRILSEGGGYILNSVHNIQADVPPENICAMFDAALQV